MDRFEHSGQQARDRAQGSQNLPISRKKFVELGLSSAALLSVGAVEPLVPEAEAQTTGSVGHLRDYCVGNGIVDDTANVQKCFDNHRTVVVDAVNKAGNRAQYGIKPGGRDLTGIRLHTGQVVMGTSATAPGIFKRLDGWQKGMVLFRNEDYTNGNKNITMKDLIIEGRRGDDPTVEPVDSDNDATGFRFKVNSNGLTDPGEKLTDINMTNVELRNFPGIGISVFNGRRIRYTNVRNINSARGGIRFTAHSNDIILNNVKSLDTGDTSFGFWASNVVLSEDKESVAGNLFDITLENCQSNTRDDSQFGAALMLRGARNVTVKGTNSRFGPSKNDVIQLYEERFKTSSGRIVRFIPKDITITGAALQGGRDNSFQVIADSAERVKIQNSTMTEPANNCVSLMPLTHNTPHTLDVAILDNTLVRPGLKHIRIDDDIRGVTVSRNKLVYDDAKAPTISKIEPAKGSTVKRRKVYIKAVVKDNAGGSGVAKKGIKVIVDGRKSTFDYFPNSGNLVCPKKLGNGKHKVKITAKDLAGNATSKSWAFRVKV